MENTDNGAAPAVSDDQKTVTPPAGQAESNTDDFAATKAKLEKSVQAEKNLRARLKEAEAAEAKLKQIEEASLSESEKLKKQIAELETAKAASEKLAQRARAQVVASANGCEPEAAALWLDTQTLTDWSDDSIKTALASAPNWVKAQQAGVTTQPSNPIRQGAALTKEMIEKMSEAEINANWPEVQRVLSK